MALALARAQPVVAPVGGRRRRRRREVAAARGPKLGSISGFFFFFWALEINSQCSALFSGLINQLVCYVCKLPHSGATRHGDLDVDSDLDLDSESDSMLEMTL